MGQAVAERRLALVTGASSGIGDAIARRLAAAGFRVFGASRKAPADPVSGIEHVTIDVDDDSSVRGGVAKVLGDAGRIDVLVNNAPCAPQQGHQGGDPVHAPAAGAPARRIRERRAAGVQGRSQR